MPKNVGDLGKLKELWQTSSAIGQSVLVEND